MNAKETARRLGGEVSGRDTILCPGPGHSPKDRSLAVKLVPTAPDGFLIHSHAGDDWRLCRDHVRQRLGLPRWEPGDDQRRNVPPRHTDKWDLAAVGAEAEEGPRAWTEDEIVRIENARRLWEASHDPRGTLAERYLREHRRLDLPDDLAGRVLRFHPSCPWRNENTGKTDRIPALIVPFRSIDDDALTAVHRIALNCDGTKLGRRMLGIVHRAAIKLDPISEQLGVGEGVETCMASRELGFGPTWAVGSTGGISFFPIIDGVKTLLILGERGDGSVLDMVMHVALSREYRGRRVQGGVVVYCAFEGQTGFEVRSAAFRKRFLAEHDDPVPFYLEPVTLDLVKDAPELIRVIRLTLGDVKPVVIVLDTLNRSLRGSESRDEDMGAYIRAADSLREAFDCAVIIVHHCGLEGNRPRGHTSLTGAAEALLAVSRGGTGEIVMTVEYMSRCPLEPFALAASSISARCRGMPPRPKRKHVGRKNACVYGCTYDDHRQGKV